MNPRNWVPRSSRLHAMNGYSRSEPLPPISNFHLKIPEGPGFQPGHKSHAKGASTLPQAGVQAHPNRQNRLPQRSHKILRSYRPNIHPIVGSHAKLIREPL